MPDSVLIAVPAYNAEHTVEGLFARIPHDAVDQTTRYVAVDDGSSDATLEALERVQSRSPSLVVLRHEKNRGYGGTVKTLLSHALEIGTRITVILHADGQYAPEKLRDLLEPLRRGEVELVQGSRMLGGGALSGGMPLYKYVANRILTAIENRAFGMHMAEFHSGYMLYSRKTLTAIPFARLSDSFDFDLEMLVCAKILGLPIGEVSVPTRYADEVSHLNPVSYGLDVLAVVRRYRGGYYDRLLGASALGQEGPSPAVREGA